MSRLGRHVLVLRVEFVFAAGVAVGWDSVPTLWRRGRETRAERGRDGVPTYDGGSTAREPAGALGREADYCPLMPTLTNHRYRAAGTPNDSVDRAAHVIRGFSVAQIGEASGHDQRLDAKTLEQIVALGTAAGERGMKARFTHPTDCNDGMGKFLGRAKNFRLDGDRVRADLHIADSAFKTPSGDLASYVMDLAEEDPQAFGASIVFDGTAEYELDESNVPKIDPVTKKKLMPVTRVTKLKAVDVVDTPAANGEGFFADDQRQTPAHVASALDRLPATSPAELVSRAATFLSSYSELRFGQPIDRVALTQAFSAALGAGLPTPPPEPKDDPMPDTQAKSFSQAEVDQLLATKTKEAIDKAFADKRGRDEAILALCESRYSGDKTKARERAETFFSDANVTPASVQQVLFAEMATALKNPGPDASADPLAGGEANKAKAAEEKLRQEFRENAKTHTALGLTEDEYVKFHAGKTDTVFVVTPKEQQVA